jgi:hypothetical protein
MVMHIYNPFYSGGRGRRLQSQASLGRGARPYLEGQREAERLGGLLACSGGRAVGQASTRPGLLGSARRTGRLRGRLAGEAEKSAMYVPCPWDAHMF